ncbi:BON domain-containing protein [Paraburkholderia sp. JHI869]|uniref:BON domain-containing protein n=1 Tax=Paraburkholderia sp. JHI869 TaxID=3112959 RepID=UPI00317C283A
MSAIGVNRQSAGCARAVRLAAALACSGVLVGSGSRVALAQTSASPSEATSAPASAAADAQRKNWYNDPFFALSSAIQACPQPLGPLMTKAEADDDAHYRVERGTTCWLAHKCSKPNSYLYDADIAAAIRQQLQGDALFVGTSIWITVQRRFVYAEGCVGPGFDSAALERKLTAIPDVEQVFVRVSSDPRGALPYKTLSSAP